MKLAWQASLEREWKEEGDIGRVRTRPRPALCVLVCLIFLFSSPFQTSDTQANRHL